MTLVDPSAGMLAHSRKLNPECAHHEGDMRTFRLGNGGQFDRASAMGVDGSGDIYVTGYSLNKDLNHDFVTIKYAKRLPGT